jgi:exodeoxyribonuclease VII large subunit
MPKRQISLFDEASSFEEVSVDRSANDIHPHDDGSEASPTQPDRPTAVTVSAVNNVAREVLERGIPSLWVVGEVANWRRVSSGHCYFSLRDEHAQLPCMMWRSDARELPADPEEGMEVYARGRVTLYEPRGRYQLVVRAIEGKGEGLWRLAFERLRRKLAAEGLLDPSLRRPLPAFPRRIGVVTSRTGAAVRDVVTVLQRRAPWADILVSHCRVQGREAAVDVSRALDTLARHGAVDVVIVTRGGGSVEDLWAFNEEILARAVAACPVPVVSAIGHEIDVTIVDLVADLRAPTPSAAAELVVPDIRVLRSDLNGLAESLTDSLRGVTGRTGLRIERLGERMNAAAQRRLDRWTSSLERFGLRLDAHSPLGTMGRGYAVPLAADGTVLRRTRDFEAGMPFTLRVSDGRVACHTDEADKRTRAMAEGENDI